MIADVNECARGTDRCHLHATCTNTQGSYMCSCDNGYTKAMAFFAQVSQTIYKQIISMTFSCLYTNPDINECLSSNGGCHHNCHDSDGSYTCSCKMATNLTLTDTHAKVGKSH